MASIGTRLSKIETKPWKLRPEVLLCPNIPKPMHGVAPRVVLGQLWWDDERRAAYRSTNHHCVACGVHKLFAKYHQWLEGHELYDIDYAKGWMTYVETVPLCHACHNFIHSGRMSMLVDKGEMPVAKFREIMDHGERVLRDHQLSLPRPHSGLVAEWGKWRLVIGLKKHPPKFKTERDWLKEYQV